MTQRSPFRYFKTSPEIIRLAVMMYIRFPLSLRNVEDLLDERGIEISHETVRFWWDRFGPLLAADIRKRRVSGLRSSRWRWQLDEVFVKINGARHYLWRAVDHEGEVLESFVTKTRDKMDLSRICAARRVPTFPRSKQPRNAAANSGGTVAVRHDFRRVSAAARRFSSAQTVVKQTASALGFCPSRSSAVPSALGLP
jgi:hypothetical protein